MRLAVELVSGPLQLTSSKKKIGNLRSPKWLFLGMHYPLSWSNGRRNRGSLIANVVGPWERNAIPFFPKYFHSYEERRDEGQTWRKFLKTTFFGRMLKENQHVHLWCMVTSLGPCLVYAYLGGPKALKMHLFEIWTGRCDHGKKKPSDMGQLHAPWRKQPLSYTKDCI